MIVGDPYREASPAPPTKLERAAERVSHLHEKRQALIAKQQTAWFFLRWTYAAELRRVTEALEEAYCAYDGYAHDGEAGARFARLAIGRMGAWQQIVGMPIDQRIAGLERRLAAVSRNVDEMKRDVEQLRGQIGRRQA